MTWKSLISVSILCFSACPAAAEQSSRQAGAHQHGHGTLNIAIEGSAVAVELIAPGSDIAGFEHEARSEAEKAALGEAKARLEDVLALLTPSPEAQCTVVKAVAGIRAEEHGEEENGEHTEHFASYELACAAPHALKSISLGYFDVFARAEELEVTVIGGKGQSRLEASRANRVIDLSGIAQ
jgi:hypothetical protein